jgi:hypothetical protein
MHIDLFFFTVEEWCTHFGGFLGYYLITNLRIQPIFATIYIHVLTRVENMRIYESTNILKSVSTNFNDLTSIVKYTPTFVTHKARAMVIISPHEFSIYPNLPKPECSTVLNITTTSIFSSLFSRKLLRNYNGTIVFN